MYQSVLNTHALPTNESNSAYIKLSWKPFDVISSKITGEVPADMDLILLGTNIVNSIPDNRYAIYSLNPNSLNFEGVFHSGEPDGDERLLIDNEELYIDFNRVSQNVERFVIIALSNAIPVDNGSTFRTPLDKVKDLNIHVQLSDGTLYDTKLEGLTTIKGKFAFVYGVFERTFDENGGRTKFAFNPIMDVDIPHDLVDILVSYGAKV